MKAAMFTLGVFLAFFLSVGCARAQSSRTMVIPPDAPVQKVEMTAEKFQFMPNVVTVKQGAHVILNIRSLDVTHGIRIPDFDIKQRIPAKKTVTVDFYAAKPGTYSFRCARFCGSGHFGMKGKIVVEPALGQKNAP